MAASISGLDTLHCDFIVPGPRTSLEAVSRWSDTSIYSPALIVTPNTEEDMRATIFVAKNNSLSIITGGGGHGTFIAVDSKIIYLDIRKFKIIKLDKEQGRV